MITFLKNLFKPTILKCGSSMCEMRHRRLLSVRRQSIERFTTKHKDKEQYFYAGVLSHLLKNKLQKGKKLVLNIAEKGTSTKNQNLTSA